MYVLLTFGVSVATWKGILKIRLNLEKKILTFYSDLIISSDLMSLCYGCNKWRYFFLL